MLKFQHLNYNKTRTLSCVGGESKIETKVCKKCNKELPLSKFSKNKKSKDGLQGWCKDCQKEYYKNNRQSRLEYSAKWKKENHEYRLLAFRLYYKDNKDIYRKRYKKNKIKIDKYGKQWRKENPDRVNMYSKNYYHKVMSLPHTLTEDEWQDTLKEFDNKCAYCGEETVLEKEHFVPVSKDGGYTVDNILPVCRRCNSCKNNNDFFEWYPNQEFYDEEREIHILKFLGYEERDEMNG